MARWSACQIEIRNEAGAPLFEDDDVDVRLEDDELLISYWDDRGAVVFAGSRMAPAAGEETAPETFDLWCRSRPRRATLRREPDGGFAGSWSEADERGTWLLRLSEG